MNRVHTSNEKPKKNGYYICRYKCNDSEIWDVKMLYWEDGVWLLHKDRTLSVNNVSHWMYTPEFRTENSKTIESTLEPENEEPCEFCSKFDFSTVMIDMVGGVPKVCIAGGLTRFSHEKQFAFCPICGRSLK